LSLILCDNVVELLAHEQCEIHLSRDAAWQAAPKLSEKDSEAARGQYFQPKLDLLQRRGVVTQAERDFSAQAHILRNECYHAAATHFDISWRVAWEYHELACDLFGRLGQSGMTWGGPVHQSAAAKELLEKSGIAGDGLPANWGEAFSNLTALLRGTKPDAAKTLSEVLSAAARRRFGEIRSTIEFLAHDGLETDNLEDAIREAYFWKTFDFESIAVGVDIQTPEGFADLHQRREDSRTAFISPLRMVRVEGWVARAESLTREVSPAIAMVKYMDLRRESEKAYTILHEAGRQLDEAIQLQIDINRGK
jgi:hypothetical protein